MTSHMSNDFAPGTPLSGSCIVKPDEKRSKHLLNLLPKLPSSESLPNSPCPGSPGMSDSTFDRSPEYCSKLTRKESYKAQRKNYHKEKRRVTNELLNSLNDPSVVMLADWLKIRGTLKSWTKLWCMLKPGVLLLYKNPKAKSSHWVGTIMLSLCQVIERPSKKDGFCFKLYNPLDQTIWAPRGPENETIGAVVQPLPTSYCICRARSQASGMCWLDALEVSIRSDTTPMRTATNKLWSANSHHEVQWTDADCEKHFQNVFDDNAEHTQGAELTDSERDTDHDSERNSGVEDGFRVQVPTGRTVDDEDEFVDEEDDEIDFEQKRESPDNDDYFEVPVETLYKPEKREEFAESGAQTEELGEEHKSLIWYLVKQVRPGMDLSKVVLPTFVLEDRSFLDKLSDSYYHVDILSKAVLEDDPFNRMKMVLQWYLSGFYKKPKGLKKPYNPILGEVFRCFWLHKNMSKTFYIAEQVSHHPPVSAFHVSNRQDGFQISGSILARSKYYGNSTCAILDGTVLLTLLPRGEAYTMTVPYANCKGILMGTLTMELGGKITISCVKTGYYAELEFKLKPFLGGAEQTNCIVGRIKLNDEILAIIDGYWDGNIRLLDKRTNEEELFWKVDTETLQSRLVRYVVPLKYLQPLESHRLWRYVSAAIVKGDMHGATYEKTLLEEAQRASCKERNTNNLEWIPSYFQYDSAIGQWIYKHKDDRPWDPRNDLFTYESNFIIKTKTNHPTKTMGASTSLLAVDTSQVDTGSSTVTLKKRSLPLKQGSSDVNDTASTSEGEFQSDSSQSTKDRPDSVGATHSNASIMETLQEMEQKLQSQAKVIRDMQISLNALVECCVRDSMRIDKHPTYAEVALLVMTFSIFYAVCSFIFQTFFARA